MNALESAIVDLASPATIKVDRNQVAVIFNGTDAAASAAAFCGDLPDNLVDALPPALTGAVSIFDAALGYSERPIDGARGCTYNYACSWWWVRCVNKDSCVKYKKGRCTRYKQICSCVTCSR